MKQFLPLITFLLGLGIFLVWNWYMIKKLNKKPHHGKQEAWRTGLWVFLALHFAEGLLPMFFAYLAGYYLAFWFPFNTLLNLMRGEEWNYISADPKASWTDRIMRIWPGAFIPLSVLFMIMGIGFLIWPLGY